MSYWCIARLVATGDVDALGRLRDALLRELPHDDEPYYRSHFPTFDGGSHTSVPSAVRAAPFVLREPVGAWRLHDTPSYLALTFTAEQLPTLSWLTALAAGFPELDARVRAAHLGYGWFMQLEAARGSCSMRDRKHYEDDVRSAVALDFGFDPRRVWRHRRGRRYPGNLLALTRCEPRQWPAWAWPRSSSYITLRRARLSLISSTQ